MYVCVYVCMYVCMCWVLTAQLPLKRRLRWNSWISDATEVALIVSLIFFNWGRFWSRREKSVYALQSTKSGWFLHTDL
jgi:hypothetical protein